MGKIIKTTWNVVVDGTGPVVMECPLVKIVASYHILSQLWSACAGVVLTLGVPCSLRRQVSYYYIHIPLWGQNIRRNNKYLPVTYLCCRESHVRQLLRKLLASFCTVVRYIEKSFTLQAHTHTHKQHDHLIVYFFCILVAISPGEPAPEMGN